MSSRNKTPLDLAKETYENHNDVAFLGPPGSGKSVVAVLMKDAVYKYYKQQHPEITFNVVQGNNFLATAEENMFVNQIFPIKTPTGNPDEIVYQIEQENNLGSGIQLKIIDISGEDYESAFLGEDMSPSQRLRHIVTYTSGKAVLGPLAYSPFAKMYFVLVDCSQFDDWRAKQTRYSQLLNSICNVKDELGKTMDGKFATPLAVVLTKSDKIPDNEATNSEELVKKHMPQFYDMINLKHNGRKGFFKLHIDLQPNDENMVEDTSSALIKKPLSYSNEEYVKLIHWIITNFPRS